MNFYFSYYGNKRREMKEIEKFIKLKNIKRIIEPFCGSCAFSLYCYYEMGFEGEIILNDNDPMLIKFLRSIKNNSSKIYVDLINKLLVGLNKKKHKYIVEQFKKKPENLILYFFYNKVYALRKGLFPLRGIKFLEHEKYEDLDEFFMDNKVKLCNEDYKVIFDKYKNDSQTLFFIDPPYFSSFNSTYNAFQGKKTGKNKILIDNTKMFVDIVNLLKSKCKVLGAINSPLILQHLYKGFVRKLYDKTYQTAKNKTKHMIITNY